MQFIVMGLKRDQGNPVDLKTRPNPVTEATHIVLQLL